MNTKLIVAIALTVSCGLTGNALAQGTNAPPNNSGAPAGDSSQVGATRAYEGPANSNDPSQPDAATQPPAYHHMPTGAASGSAGTNDPNQQ